MGIIDTMDLIDNIVREKRGKKEKKREKREESEKKREIERNREKKDVQGQLLSICFHFSKRKTKYISRNARKVAAAVDLYIDHRHYKSSFWS